LNTLIYTTFSMCLVFFYRVSVRRPMEIYRPPGFPFPALVNATFLSHTSYDVTLTGAHFSQVCCFPYTSPPPPCPLPPGAIWVVWGCLWQILGICLSTPVPGCSNTPSSTLPPSPPPLMWSFMFRFFFVTAHNPLSSYLWLPPLCAFSLHWVRFFPVYLSVSRPQTTFNPCV